MTATHASPGFLSLGQETAKTVVRRAAAGGRLQRTLLVHGPAGAAKDAFVNDLLALTFCAASDPEVRPCNDCRGCRGARTRSHPDLVIGSPDLWREMRSPGESIVAVARRWIGEAAGAPIAGDRRVVLIERADRANETIQNALLKALEEPGGRQMFILVADEPARVLPTIRSRSQALRMGPVPRDELAAWLVDQERLPADQADVLARISGGLVGTATSYARSPELVAWRRGVQTELLALLDRGRADRFVAVRELLEQAMRTGATGSRAESSPEAEEPVRTPTSVQREAALLLVEVWIDLARDLTLAAAGRPAFAASGDLLAGLAAVAARLQPPQLAALTRRLEEVHEALRQNASPRLALEAAMLAWPFL